MGDLINGRTPEEIKTGLRIHATWGQCKTCPYETEEEVERGDCIDRLTKDVYALIERLESERDAALAKAPRWISVKVRLPGKQYWVFVRSGHNLVTTGWRSYHVDVKGGELWEVDEAHNYRNDVTHWMPLPNLPEEDM